MTSPLPRPAEKGADRAAIRSRGAGNPIVYRYYDDSGRLLYVGSTQNMARRDWEHRSGGTGAFWFPSVTETRIQDFPTIAEARAAEALAIREESPAYNTAGTGMKHGSRQNWTLEDYRLYWQWEKRPRNTADWWTKTARA